jgi:hypothetical protein
MHKIKMQKRVITYRELLFLCFFVYAPNSQLSVNQYFGCKQEIVYCLRYLKIAEKHLKKVWKCVSLHRNCITMHNYSSHEKEHT